MKSKLIYIGFLVIIALNGKAQDAPDFVLYSGRGDVFALTTTDEAPFSILSDSADFVAMQLALANLQNDFLAVAGKKPALTYNTKQNLLNSLWVRLARANSSTNLPTKIL